MTTSPDETARPTPWFRATFRALRHPNYALYFFGQLISLTGAWVQGAALTWLAYDLTRESRWPALVSAGQILPILLLGVWAGSLADHFPRRPLIFLAQTGLLILSLVLAGLVVCDAVTPIALLVVALLIGVMNAVDNPARLAFVMDMVGREDLINAVALNSLVFNLARALGPAIAGWLLPRTGSAACFLVNGITFLAFLGALVAMRLPPYPSGFEARTRQGSLLDGFRHLAGNLSLILLLVLAGSLAFFGWPILSLLPALADLQLHQGDTGYAQMVSAIGVGALTGALLVASFGSPARRRLFLGAGVVLGAGALLGLSQTRTLPLAVVCCALAGAGLILFFATGQATLQLSASDHNRGRVMSIWLVVLAGAQPLGNLVAGPTADSLGVSTMLIISGSGIAVAGLVVLIVHTAAGWSKR
ncbi:MAG: MFS transporter [Gemmataceae bacterium]